MKHLIKILSKEFLTHDVLKIVAEKPEALDFKPGQAVDLSINKPGWEETFRPFTFTSLPSDTNIEFNIKTYPSHQGVTNQLLHLSPGDELLIQDPFGEIAYKGEGIFIAGGAGITPFIAIFRQLKSENKVGNCKLIFANKTKADIILEDSFKALLGKNFINVLSDEKLEGYEYGHISEEIIRKQIDGGTKYFYLCGPEPMMEAVEKQLSSLGISQEAIVKEGF